jgi:DNA repair protein RAD50
MEILNSAKSKCESEIEKAQLDVDRLQKEARATSAGRAAIGIVRRMFELDSTRSALLQEKAKLESELRAVIVDNRIAEMRETAGLGAFIPGSDKNSSSSSYNRNKDNEIDLISEDEEEADETASRKRARGSSVAPSSAISNRDDPIAVLENTIWQLDQRLKSLLQDQARIDGQISIVSTSMKEARKEEETNLDLVNCEKRYRDALVEATVLENIVADLETYQKALDSALMRYHQIKVAEINNIIRELWQSTYKGADIDNIEIASDFEEREDGASSTAKGSKSYNYRVCMAKGEAKLDMRGRCSAGQKVLASIVIRLALAETFCVNTGILALDEPTTNLDLPNKKGLAEALAKVIELRRGSNLQLIVITHDEEFVSELSRALEGGGGTDSKNQIGQYYRVFREEVRPGVFHSHVQAQDFD